MPKILVIRFSAIGDIVLTSPVVRCLKKQLGAEVHFLTKKAFSGLVSNNPNIDKVWSWDQNLDVLLTDLRSEKFDWVIDLHHNLRSARVKWALGRPSRAFQKLNIEKWLYVHFKINLLPDIHIVDRYMRAVKHLGVVYDGLGLDFFIPPEGQIKPSAFDPRLSANNYLAFALGGTHATKRLPVEKMIEVCRQIPDTILLLGGAADEAAAKELTEAMDGKAVNACGRLTLHQSADLIRQAGKVLSHDTGLMHIAAAFQKDIVSLWGNTTPAFGMYPFYPTQMQKNTSIEVAGLSCRPCSKIGYENCPKGHFKCMRDQDSAAIAALSRLHSTP